MRDIAGHTLRVGDTVAVSRVGHRNMTLGTILRFTGKGMKVAILDRNGQQDETYRTFDMVCLTSPVTF